MIKRIMAALTIGLLAGGVIGAMQIGNMTPEMAEQVIAQFGFKQAVILIAMIQTSIFTIFATVVGTLLSPKVKLDRPFEINRKFLIFALMVGTISALFISLSEKLVFVDLLGLSDTYDFSGIYLVSSLLYGGIVEEILLRWGLMTFIVWVGSKISRSTENKGIYVWGIILSALVFSIGHLPATSQMLGLSTGTVMRAMILNFVPGVGFGYLYWKQGIGYAILGHMATHLINQLILLPLLF